jgi:transcriptional regulator with XRE-family HTH domain
MGRSARPKPKRLPDKLLHIRLALGLSQNELLMRLGLKEKLLRAAVSGYELGTIEPPLPVILQYARAANISTDVLIDDELDVPAKLPATSLHKGSRMAKKP